jgi:hypothetical protein
MAEILNEEHDKNLEQVKTDDQTNTEEFDNKNFIDVTHDDLVHEYTADTSEEVQFGYVKFENAKYYDDMKEHANILSGDHYVNLPPD